MSTPVVVVVEDNSELRHVLKEALAAAGCSVLTGRDEAEALELLRANPVDLLISDLTAPSGGSGGLDAVREEFPGLPILSTASGGHSASLLSVLGRDSQYRTLSKPFRLGELLAVSRELLEAAR
jgi:DNA-binding response OmpR family regulator